MTSCQLIQLRFSLGRLLGRFYAYLMIFSLQCDPCETLSVSRFCSASIVPLILKYCFLKLSFTLCIHCITLFLSFHRNSPSCNSSGSYTITGCSHTLCADCQDSNFCQYESYNMSLHVFNKVNSSVSAQSLFHVIADESIGNSHLRSKHNPQVSPYNYSAVTLSVLVLAAGSDVHL